MSNLRDTAYNATLEVIEKANLSKGDILVVGCSSSEIGGAVIGTDSNEDIAGQVFSGIYSAVK